MLNVYMNTILFFGALRDIGSSSQELFVFQGDFIKKYFLPCRDILFLLMRSSFQCK